AGGTDPSPRGMAAGTAHPPLPDRSCLGPPALLPPRAASPAPFPGAPKRRRPAQASASGIDFLVETSKTTSPALNAPRAQNGEDEPHADKAGHGKASDAQERKSPQERPPARLHDEGRADDEGGDDDPRGQPVPHDVEAMNQVFQALVAELDFQLSRPHVVHHAVHFAGHADDDLRE